MPITIRYGRKVLSLCVGPGQTVLALKKLAGKKFGIPKAMRRSIIFRLRRSTTLQSDEMMLQSDNRDCELQLCLGVKGGARFHSIPVENIRPLMDAIRVDFDEWIRVEGGEYPNGAKVVWDGFSGSVQYYFKTAKINPWEKYNKFYSTEERTVAVSYVWSATDILHMAGALCIIIMYKSFCSCFIRFVFVRVLNKCLCFR